MKLTVLVDNNTYIDRYLFGEPAVSYFIESAGTRILFDAGYSDVFLKNAAILGIKLAPLDCIVLSHGHNDHTRGLRFLFGQCSLNETRLICCPECLLPKRSDGEDIGAPFAPDTAKAVCRYSPAAQPVWINDECVFLGVIPRSFDFEQGEPIGEYKTASGWQADMQNDDSALAFKTEQGLFIVTGCSHSGICNICEHAKAVCGDDLIFGIIGGFHLIGNSERLNKTIDYLKSQKIALLYPAHCVSLEAKIAMSRELKIGETGSGLTLEL